MKSRDETYRALIKGELVDPGHAHAYIKRAFKQACPHVLGAMRHLASAFDPEDLNSKGYGLYADFRPESHEWGSRSEMKLHTILDLRSLSTAHSPIVAQHKSDQPTQMQSMSGSLPSPVGDSPKSKRPRLTHRGHSAHDSEKQVTRDDA
jgi:hypothetical protein